MVVLEVLSCYLYSALQRGSHPELQSGEESNLRAGVVESYQGMVT